MGRPHPARVGVTWIDLVVVLAVGVLLAPLVVPVLRDASEQARVDKCLSNLRGLMAATGAYLGDYAEFPFIAPSQVNPATGEISAICTWAYGGATNDLSNDHYWKTDNDGVFFVPAGQRPINTYLLGAPVQADLYADGQLLQRTPIPGLRCPSDRYTHQRSYFSYLGAQPFSCYDDVGTSYQYNLHALNPEFATGYGYGLLWNGQQSDLWRGPGSWIDVGKVLVRQVLARHSASFTMFLEDPMDWGLSQDTLEIGNHAELGKHSCGYLDGHADYAYRETRGWCGPGWEAINPDWVQRVGMEIPRPVAYRDLFVNCVPPYGVAENGAIPDSKRGRARYDAGGRVNKSDASARTGGEP